MNPKSAAVFVCVLCAAISLVAWLMFDWLKERRQRRLDDYRATQVAMGHAAHYYDIGVVDGESESHPEPAEAASEVGDE